MSWETLFTGISVFITAIIGLGVYLNSRRTVRASERKLTVEEQVAEDDREDVIARRRREELDRLYVRVSALEAAQAELLTRLGIAERREREMHRHILLLEDLVPYPPGPPARPVWSA